MKPIVFLPEAEQEMLEAAIHYQSKASGLGIDYLSEACDRRLNLQGEYEIRPYNDNNLKTS